MGGRPGIRQFRFPRLPGQRRPSDFQASQAPVDTVPTAAGFDRRRTNFQIDITQAFEQPRRQGMQVPRALDPSVSQEAAYQAFLRKEPNITRPEFYVHQGLERKGLRSPLSEPPGMDFEYSVHLFTGDISSGGERESDFTEADFRINAVAPPLIIEVDGEFWHFQDVDARRSDEIARAGMESLGYRVVAILAQDTLDPNRLDQVLTLGMLGVELDHDGRVGVFR